MTHVMELMEETALESMHGVKNLVWHVLREGYFDRRLVTTNKLRDTLVWWESKQEVVHLTR